MWHCEAADEVGALHSHAVKGEVGKVGIEPCTGMASEKPPPIAVAGAPGDPTEDRHPRPGLRVRPSRSGLEQHRSARIRLEVSGMIGEVGKQQDRAAVAVAGNRDQRCKGPALVVAKRRRQRRRARPAHQPARGGGGHLVLVRLVSEWWRSTMSRSVTMPTGVRAWLTTSARESLNRTRSRTAYSVRMSRGRLSTGLVITS
jgi:hypothetical protein